MKIDGIGLTHKQSNQYQIGKDLLYISCKTGRTGIQEDQGRGGENHWG